MPLIVGEGWGNWPVMTETRWLSEWVDIREMVHFALSMETDPTSPEPIMPKTAAVNPVMSQRKQTLFMCACTRESRLWSNWKDCQSIEIIEGNVDRGNYPTDIETKVVNFARLAAYQPPVPRMRVAIMRELVPNPFTHMVLRPRHTMPPLLDHLGRRLVVFPSEWATPNVVTAANQAYQFMHKTNDVMHSLASQLQQAGCQDARILNHLTTPRRHYKGCWVVDLLLGRE